MTSKPIVLLFHPKTLHEKAYRYYYIPYSVLSIGSALDQSRFEVRLIDNNVRGVDDYRDELAEMADRILVVGVSAMIGHQIRDGWRFAEAVRDVMPEIPIVWGGPLPTILPQETLSDHRVDIVVQGQAEASIQELTAALQERRSLTDIKGVTFQSNGHTVRNPPRPLTDVNSFPPYNYDLLNPRDYVRFDENINERTVSHHSSQGCPFNCGFCAETSLWNNRWSGMGPDRILTDIRQLVNRYEVDGIKFYDSEFFINQKRALDFARGVIDEGLGIRWAASVHPSNLDRLSPDQMNLLRDSGCTRLLIGAESGVQEEVDLIGKRSNREMVERLAHECGAHDIVASFTFVTGYPTSPPEAIDTTLRFAEDLRRIDSRHEAKVHFYAPYPGTPLYPLALKSGFQPPKTLEEWSYFDYYEVTTPWVDKSYEPLVREFNEEHYPYLHPLAADVNDTGSQPSNSTPGAHLRSESIGSNGNPGAA